MSNSRFIVAIHVLGILATDELRAFTSQEIAGSVSTNPVVIRRVLALLAKAELVTTAEGARGGTTLARSAKKITFADVYHAVEEDATLFALPRAPGNPDCPIGCHAQAIIEKHLQRIENATLKEMKKSTLADVLEEILAASKA